MIFGVEFYDQVLRELIAAVGAALFLGNAFALVRRRSATGTTGIRAGADSDDSTQLTKAPIARTVTFMLMGLIVMVWSLASLLR